MKTNTGGPAFPTPVDGATDGRTHDGGMTLLDWMAGQALAGLLANPNPMPWNSVHPVAYAHAESMLAEKARREAVVQQSSTTDDSGKMAKLEALNRELVEVFEVTIDEAISYASSGYSLHIQTRDVESEDWVLAARAVLAKSKEVA